MPPGLENLFIFKGIIKISLLIRPDFKKIHFTIFTKKQHFKLLVQFLLIYTSLKKSKKMNNFFQECIGISKVAV